jgi:hypothetical protein
VFAIFELADPLLRVGSMIGHSLFSSQALAFCCGRSPSKCCELLALIYLGAQVVVGVVIVG